MIRLIIDAHCHIWEEKYISTEMKELVVNSLKEGFYDQHAKHFKFDPALITNVSPEGLVQEMDEAGLDKTILLALDYELAFKGKLSYKEYNDYVAEILKKFPDRFIGFAGIDPRRGLEAISELERCLDQGMTGVKLWPLTGFYPDDPQFYPFYERVEELNVPILCHTGSCPPTTYMKYNRPVYVDKVAVDFPNIKIIMAHIGQPWTNEAISVAAKNKNVFFDISSWQVSYKIAPLALFQVLLTAKTICGVKKILFGSDWPIFTPLLSQKEWVDAINKLQIPPPLKLMGFPEFTEEEKKKILGGNAIRVLGL